LGRSNLEKRQKARRLDRGNRAAFPAAHTIRVDLEHSLGEERLRAIGRSNEGRYVFLVFTIRERNGEHLIRSISARYMHREEVEYYEKENPDLQD
jgi:uncharacterized protein